MCAVYALCVEGESWQGTYGGALLHRDGQWVAITSDGKRHSLISKD